MRRFIYAAISAMDVMVIGVLLMLASTPASTQLPQVTVVGTIAPGHCTGFASTLQLQDTGVTCGTAGNIVATTVTASNISAAGMQVNGASPQLSLGANGGSVGGLVFNGSTSGSLTLQPSNTTTPSGTISIPSGPGTLAFTIGQTLISFRAPAVNFNSANTDTSVAITIPTGVSRYFVNAARVGNCSASVSTATAGLFTASGGGGVAVVTTTAMTITTAATDTNNNSQVLGVNNPNTQSYNDTTLFFRIGTAQGSAATCDVNISIVPI